MNKKSGLAGFSGIIIAILAIVLIPKLFSILGWLIILALIVIIAFIIVLLVFAFKSGRSTGSSKNSGSSSSSDTNSTASSYRHNGKETIDGSFREVFDEDDETVTAENRATANPYSSTYRKSANPYSSTYRSSASPIAPEKPEEKTQKAEPLPKELKKTLDDTASMRSTCALIKDEDVTNLGLGICSTTEKIIGTLREKPEKIASNRQLINYYIPTVKEVLEKFQKLEASEVPTDDMTLKIKDFLPEVQQALDNQYDSLFDNDKLNMTVNMEAMSIALRRDGLIDDLGISSSPLMTMGMGIDSGVEANMNMDVEASQVIEL